MGTFGEASWDMVVSGAGVPPQTVKAYYKNNKVRLEMAAGGQNVIMIADNDAKVAYMYIPDQNAAMKMSTAQFQQQQQGNTGDAGAVAQEAEKGKLVGQETVDGKVCDVYEYMTSAGATKSWIWREKGFPLKSEVTMAQCKVTTEFKNVSFDPVSDSLFQLPSGVQVTDFGSLPGGIPQKP